MKELRISSGSWKGKKVKETKEVAGHSNFTNSLLKKAVFSILDSRLNELSLDWSDLAFIDYFSGSGQMSLEALSLGASQAMVYELDNGRFGTLIQQFGKTENVLLFRKDSTRFPLKWDMPSQKFLVFYLDPPYTYWSQTPDRMQKMINDVYQFALNSGKPFIILSQISENQSTKTIWKDIPIKIRPYGSHLLVEISSQNHASPSNDSSIESI